MNFLEYSNNTQSNIIPKEAFEELVHEVFGVIADNLSKSLGPLGSSATILDGMMTEATKDGYSILKKYRFHNRYKKMIYNLILAPCTKVNNTVGDATTTVIVLTNNLFSRYKDRKSTMSQYYRLPRQFTAAWDEVVAEISKTVQASAKPLDPDDYHSIYNLAYVTSNGNQEISTAIATTYKQANSPAIRQKDSPTNKSYVTAVNGYDFPANLISDAFVRNEDLSATEKDLAVMIFDHKIETDYFNQVIVPINNVLRAMNKKLLILAPFYDAYMCDTVVDQYVRMEFQQYRKINLILGQYATGKLQKNQLSDLATVLRAKVINQDLAAGLLAELGAINVDTLVSRMIGDDSFKFCRFIGRAAKALLSCTAGSVFEVPDVKDDPVYKNVLNQARKDMEDIKAKTSHERQAYSAKIADAVARVNQLEMKNYIYYIGADSDLQKQIIWDSVEDVIKCVRSAIRNGVVPGCQLTVANACDAYINKISAPYINEERTQIVDAPSDVLLRIEIAGIIYTAVTDVYAMILHGPEGVGMVQTIPNWREAIDSIAAEARENAAGSNVPEDQVEAYVQNAIMVASDKVRDDAIQKAATIVNTSLEVNQVFDMETLEYNPGIITSAETDTMVLSAASELVKILISGNQCVFLDSDINESHQETVTI